MLDPYVGQVIAFCGNFAPQDWALCNGQLLPISQNTALFSLLGTNYGGDGKTTFGLPNLMGRTPIHPSDQYDLGKAGGSVIKQLTLSNLPAHTHVTTATIKANTGAGGTNNPVGAYPAYTDRLDPEFAKTSNGVMAADTLTGVRVQPNGNGAAFSNMQPYLAVNFIIALRGEFPQRS